MDDAMRSGRIDRRIPRYTRRRSESQPHLPVPVRESGRKRKSQKPSCPVNGKDPKLGEKINDWLTSMRKKVDEQCTDSNYQNVDKRSSYEETDISQTFDTDRNDISRTPEPIDLVASKTFMYVVSDNEEPKRRKRRRKRSKKKRSERKHRRFQEENTACLFHREQTGQPEATSIVSESLSPADTKTCTSVVNCHDKPRKAKRRRKKTKRAARNETEVMSQISDLAITARKRFREAEINVLTFRLNKLSLDGHATSMSTGRKRKYEDDPREETTGSDVKTLDAKIRKLTIN
ncbi:uncharacterized protein LOC117318086 [Pecten maximus]|uniref:uncharacterized protein LOC117318086 n=1 Tax=Pecten maximus TaxID=6579 RepID=UPI0014587CCA|nr:uncharacterized protein LOC117318086 [Pecten maximus]